MPPNSPVATGLLGGRNVVMHSQPMSKQLNILTILFLLALVGCGGSNEPSQQTAYEIPIAQLHPAIVPIYSDPYFGARCGMPLKCNNIVRIDCGSEVDGPQNYYNNNTGEVVMYCGGACLAPDPANPKACKACPPAEWSCVLPPQ